MKLAASLALVTCLLAAASRAQVGDTITTEGIVSAPPAAVWAAWTTAEGLQSWLAPQADIDLRIGGLMRANYNPKGKLGDADTIENTILAFEPERLLSIRVAKAPDSFPFRSSVSSMWTVMYFQSTGEGNTFLRIVGLGFGPDGESQKMKEYFSQGNAYTLAQLQKRFQQ